MNVFMPESVRKDIDAFDWHARASAYRLVGLLEQYGNTLGMPIAKPIGGGLWELRSGTSPAIRILYGFCNNIAILVLVLKKQRPALLPREVALARARLAVYCA